MAVAAHTHAPPRNPATETADSETSTLIFERKFLRLKPLSILFPGN
jgi:hypothetical protein